jgi:aspartyl-tRNA(Asn)/glutamyl-tRNA(Gln) amidotransferase subunit A
MDAFREAGATVEEVSLSWTRQQVFQAADAHLGSIMGAQLEFAIAEHPDLVCDYTKHFYTRETPLAPSDLYLGLEIEGLLYREFGALMERFDLFVCPTLALPALAAGESYVAQLPMLNGRELDILDHLMTIPFNILSRCPVMAVPSGFSRDGVPTGIQIVGKTYDDESVFRGALAYEKVRPWLSGPEQRPQL